MRLALRHAQAMTVELLRFPAYVVPTLVLPTVFFLFFVSSAPHDAATARMATFAGFAVIGVAFFQFGVGIAADRISPWEGYLRTLPVGPEARLVARLLSAAVFAVATAAVLVVTAVAVSGASLSSGRWAGLAAALLLGTVPFAFLGIALGYWAPPKAALPLANLLYLLLAYAGGLWTRPSGLPEAVRGVSSFLPTRALSDGLVAAVLAGSVDWRAWVTLILFSVIFAALAIAGYRRDEGRRFS
jgi:ABC-2 type transport system permease protein